MISCSIYRTRRSQLLDFFQCLSFSSENATEKDKLQLVQEIELMKEVGTHRISIYTLSDLGDLSNLIGSLSRTIQQYSPPSEWIMCELSVFPIF